MARGALQVGSEKHLTDVLRELKLDDLTGVNLTAPLDPLRESFRIRVRIDQLAGELVERLVIQQRLVEPGGNLLASAVDVAGALVLVAQEVVPEGEPVIAVSSFLIE